MTATNHAVTGAAIAVYAGHVWALPLALAAHFVMDVIPHFDMAHDSEAIRYVAIFDVLFAIAILCALTLHLAGNFPTWLILSCAFLCVSPDIVWGWRYLKQGSYKSVLSEPMSWFSRWHLKIQWSETPAGVLVELIWFGSLVTYILSK